MEFGFKPIFAKILFVALAVLGSHAAPLSSEEYWKEKLPNIPIPNNILDLLRSASGTRASTSVTLPRPVAAPFQYGYAATETQLEDNKNVAVFFLEKDLKPGTQMTLQFTKSTNEAPMLSRPVADSIPFSSSKMAEAFLRLHVAPNSEEAETMKDTVKKCEDKAIEGEEKQCATSIESMVDYVTSKLGQNVQVVTTNVQKEDSKARKYEITRVNKVLGSKTTVCHKLNYAYGVFYCHKTETITKVYKVPMVGTEGKMVNAAVACHTDTSNWNPKHLAFQLLKVKPGTVPVCHFLPEDHIIWVSN